MSTIKVRVIVISVLVLGAGLVAGVALMPEDLQELLSKKIMGDAGDQPDSGQEAGENDAHAGHVELTDPARKNLGLKTGRVIASDYYYILRVPGVIREKPGHSDHAVATTVHGIVTKVHAVPGQAVEPGDLLFELRLTGEALASAQASLLDILQQLTVIDAELKRIESLAASGGVARKRQIELKGERTRIDGQRNVRMQELLVRGLNPAQVDRIVAERKLLREFTIRVPGQKDGQQTGLDPSSPEGTPRPEVSPGDALGKEESQFTIETLEAFPGKAVRPGDSLCHLAYHTVLYVEGQAFENEIEAIGNLRRNGWQAAVEFGTEGHVTVQNGFDILYLDNHVDPDSQTYRFYIPLVNEVLQETRDAEGKLYRSWRYKPGQRVHIRIPVKKWEKQLTLPLAAVVQEGPNAYVFRRIGRMRARTDKRKRPLYTDEFEQVAVHILHQDTEVVVIDADGSVNPGDLIALNNAYQLQLALKSGGGDAHHGHTH